VDNPDDIMLLIYSMKDMFVSGTLMVDRFAVLHIVEYDLDRHVLLVMLASK